MESVQKNHSQQKQQILDDFSRKRAEQNSKRQANAKIIAEGSRFIGGSSQAAVEDAKRQVAIIDSELKRLVQQENQEVDRLEASYVRSIRTMERDLNQIGKSGGDLEANQQLEDFDLQRKIKEKERDDAIANINRRFEATMAVYEENKAKFDAEGAQNVVRERELGEEIKALIEEDGELKKDYRIQAADLQTVQLTKTACGIFSTGVSEKDYRK